MLLRLFKPTPLDTSRVSAQNKTNILSQDYRIHTTIPFVVYTPSVRLVVTMPGESSRRTKLPHRPAPPTTDYNKKQSKNKSASRKAQREEHTFQLQNMVAYSYLETHPYASSSHRDDSADWVFIPRDSAPSSNYSDDVHSYGPSQDLTASNVQLFDTLTNSPPSICAADENGQGRRCHRRCPKCRGGSVKTHSSSATRNSVYAEKARYLDPWVPVHIDSDESDVFAVGAWAMEDDMTFKAYPTTF